MVEDTKIQLYQCKTCELAVMSVNNEYNCKYCDQEKEEEKLGKAEERYLKICIEQDEGTVGEWNGF